MTLWLEITEQTQYPAEVWNRAVFKMNLQLCQCLGVKIALDDFGRDNHRDESIIRYVAPDVIKLDRSLLRRQGAQYEKFWRRLASWKLQYKFDLVAEGIETSDELDFMKSLVCPKLCEYKPGGLAPTALWA